MEKPDKIDVALMAGILCLILVNAYIIYHTWIKEKDELAAMNRQAPVRQEKLVFHDDTSITNKSSGTLWLRVRIIYKNQLDRELCRIDSDALRKGIWTQNRGWYYYRDPVSSEEHTRPLVDRLYYKDSDFTCREVKGFRLQAEAVDERWLPEIPHSGQEAFRLFRDLDQVGDDIWL